MTTETSATLDGVTTTGRSRQREERGEGYGVLWRGVPRELGFLLLTMPIAIVGLAVLQSLFWTGVGTISSTSASSSSSEPSTRRAASARWSWCACAGRAVRRSHGPSGSRGQAAHVLACRFGPFVNGHYWLYLLHTMVVNPIVSIGRGRSPSSGRRSALGGLTGWIWDRFIPHEGQSSSFEGDRRLVLRHAGRPSTRWSATRSSYIILGVLFAATLPVRHPRPQPDAPGVARGMLGAWRSEALQREVADLSASRGAAVVAEDQALRRLERDLHDGPQQRLIRLQMDIASAERKLDSRPGGARRAILAEAGQQARDTLEELRALSRGFAPPILQDRGLVVGAREPRGAQPGPDPARDGDRCRAPVLRRRSSAARTTSPPSWLTNLAKHSGATAARLLRRPSAPTPQTEPSGSTSG